MKITADNFFTTSDGIHIYFEDRGSGLPIVMVPGFLCTTKFFEKNAEVLSKEFRVITMDPRGQGNSSKTCQGNTIRRNAQDIKELIDHLGLSTSSCWAGRWPPPSLSAMQPNLSSTSSTAS